MPASGYTFIIVDGEHYRGDEWSYKTCSEIIVRGPFRSRGKPSPVFKRDGRPEFFRGMETAFKVQKSLDGYIAMAVNPRKSKKNWPTDPAELTDWEPFAEAWMAKKRGEE